MTIRKENGKIIMEFDRIEFEDLVELTGVGNCTYTYDRITSKEVKQRMQNITDKLEEFENKL